MFGRLEVPAIRVFLYVLLVATSRSCKNECVFGAKRPIFYIFGSLGENTRLGLQALRLEVKARFVAPPSEYSWRTVKSNMEETSTEIPQVFKLSWSNMLAGFPASFIIFAFFHQLNGHLSTSIFQTVQSLELQSVNFKTSRGITLQSCFSRTRESFRSVFFL